MTLNGTRKIINMTTADKKRDEVKEKLQEIYVLCLEIVNPETYGSNDYKESYNKAKATITNKLIESNDEIKNDGLLFKHEKNFRIKITYTYEIKNHEYRGCYYNDGKNEDFLEPKKFIFSTI